MNSTERVFKNEASGRRKTVCCRAILTKFGFALVVFTVFLLVTTAVCSADYAPSSPEVAELPRAERGDVGYTGDLSLGIPLMTVPGRGGLDFPLVAHYNAPIRVNQEASWIGLGWSLDIGSVQRVIIGLADYGHRWPSGSLSMVETDFMPDAFYVSTPEGKFRFSNYGTPGEPSFIPDRWSADKLEADVVLLDGDVYDITRFVLTTVDGTRYVYGLPLKGTAIDWVDPTEHGRADGYNEWKLTAILGSNYVDGGGDSLDPLDVVDDPALDNGGNWIAVQYYYTEHWGYDDRLNIPETYIYCPTVPIWGICGDLERRVKEVIYPHRIVTPTHIAQFRTTYNRFDSLKYKYCIYCEDPFNPQQKRLYMLDMIELYNYSWQSGDNNHVRWLSPHPNFGDCVIKRVVFKYFGPSQCLMPGGDIDDAVYGAKLTLSDIEFWGIDEPGFEDAPREIMPPYTFWYTNEYIGNNDPLPYSNNPWVFYCSSDYLYSFTDYWGYYTQEGGWHTLSDETSNDAHAWSLTQVWHPDGTCVEYTYENDVVYMLAPEHDVPPGVGCGGSGTEDFYKVGGARVKQIDVFYPDRDGVEVHQVYSYSYGMGYVNSYPRDWYNVRQRHANYCLEEPYFRVFNYADFQQHCIGYESVTETLPDGSRVERRYRTANDTGMDNATYGFAGMDNAHHAWVQGTYYDFGETIYPSPTVWFNPFSIIYNFFLEYNDLDWKRGQPLEEICYNPDGDEVKRVVNSYDFVEIAKTGRPFRHEHSDDWIDLVFHGDLFGPMDMELAEQVLSGELGEEVFGHFVRDWYMFNSGWARLNRTTTVVDGVASVVEYGYNLVNGLVNCVVESNGLGDMRTTETTFAFEMYPGMADKHMLTQVYETISVGSDSSMRGMRTEWVDDSGQWLVSGGKNLVDGSWVGGTFHDYDIYGNPGYIVDARGSQTSFSYDPDFNYAYVSTVINDLGHMIQYTYDAVFQTVDSITGVDGTCVVYGYDFAGRLATVTRLPDTEPVTIYEYKIDRAELDWGLHRYTQSECYVKTVQKIDDTLEVVRYDYSNGLGGYLTQLNDTVGGNVVVMKSYNDMGWVEREYQPAIGVPSVFTSYVYDGLLGRIKSVTYPDGTGVEAFYDSSDNCFMVTEVDQMGYETITLSDVLGMTTSVTREGVETVVNRGLMGDVVEVVDAEGKSTLFFYDTLGRRIASRRRDMDSFVAVSHPELGGVTEEFVYDDIGNPILVRDSNLADADKHIKIEYDDLGRETSRAVYLDSDPDGDPIEDTEISTFYDTYPGGIPGYEHPDVNVARAIGKVTYVDDPVQKTVFYYNEERLLAEKVVTLGSVDYRFEYYYNDAREVAEKTIDPNSNIKAGYVYNELGQVGSVDLIKDGVLLNVDIVFTYTSDGGIESITRTQNGVTTMYDYDELRRLELIDTDGLIGGDFARSYVYDDLGRITHMYGDNWANPDRLIGDFSGAGDYDVFGRLKGGVITSYAPNNKRQLVYDYDGVGNRLFRGEFNVLLETMVCEDTYGYFDGMNRLWRVEHDDPSVFDEFSYDPNGNIVLKEEKISEIPQSWEESGEGIYLYKVLGLDFDEGEGDIAVDSSGFGNHGTIYGAEWVVPGYDGSGYALSFDGMDDYVEVPYDDVLNIDDEITLSAWVKLDSYQQNGGIVGKAGYSWYLYIHTYRLCFALWDDSEHVICWGSIQENLELDKWYHVVAVWDGSVMKLFVDGDEKVSGVFDGQIRIAEEPVIIGCWPDFLSDEDKFFDGVIDDVRIYDKALTCALIKVLDLDLNEGEGVVAHDSSFYENHGAIYGAGWVGGYDGSGSALSFDGNNDYVLVEAGGGSVFDFGESEFSLAAWFKTGSSSGTILDATNYGGDFYRFLLESGKVVFRFSTGDVQTMVSSLTYNDDKWHYIVAVRDGLRTGRLYVDGVLVAEDIDSSGTWTAVDITSDLSIGRQVDGSNYFSGIIDEVRIFNRALTEEVLATTSYEYDYYGRLVKVLLPDGTSESYGYNAVGKRVMKFDSLGRGFVYVYNGNGNDVVFDCQVSGFKVGDVSGNGIIDLGDIVYLINYLYRNGLAPDPVSVGDCNGDGDIDMGDIVYLINYVLKNVPPGSQPPPVPNPDLRLDTGYLSVGGGVRLLSICDGDIEKINYFLMDQVGSSSVVVDSSGGVVGCREYYPFGKSFVGWGDISKYQFTGKENDESTGLYYYGARFYSPVIGRFMARDTVDDGPSPYVYCGNNPLIIIDPTGHQSNSGLSFYLDFDLGKKMRHVHAFNLGFTKYARNYAGATWLDMRALHWYTKKIGLKTGFDIIPESVIVGDLLSGDWRAYGSFRTRTGGYWVVDAYNVKDFSDFTHDMAELPGRRHIYTESFEEFSTLAPFSDEIVDQTSDITPSTWKKIIRGWRRIMDTPATTKALKVLKFVPLIGIGANIYFASQAAAEGDYIVCVGNIAGAAFEPADIATGLYEIARDNPPGPDAWRYENTKQIHYPLP